MTRVRGVTWLLSFSPSVLWSAELGAADVPQADAGVTTPAATAATNLVSTPDLSGVSSWPLVIMTLLGIVGLILCLAWFARRFGGFSAAGNSDMRVIAAIPMGARERVALIDVKGQQFLLGVTTQNINHLHSFDEPVIDLAKAPKSEFAQKLQGILQTHKTASKERD